MLRGWRYSAFGWGKYRGLSLRIMGKCGILLGVSMLCVELKKRGDLNYEKSIEIFFDFSHFAGCDLFFGNRNVLSFCTVSPYR